MNPPPKTSLADWPWNPALEQWQHDMILAWERGDHVLCYGISRGKTLMAQELRQRWMARMDKTPLRGFRADCIIIDDPLA